MKFLTIWKGKRIHKASFSPKEKRLIAIQTQSSSIEESENSINQIISFIKSAVRILGYLLIPFDLMYATIVLVISEVIGIGEELV